MPIDEKDAAKRLSVSVRMIERLIASGELPAVKIRGRVLVRLSDVLRLISEGTSDV